MSDEKQGPQQSTDGLSRRKFLGAAAATTAGMIIAPTAARWASPTYAYAQASGPNSKFGNVQIGTITYSYRSLPSNAEQLLSYLVLSGISSTELMGPPIMQYLGAPTTNAPSMNQINQMTDPAQKQAAQRQRAAFDAEMTRWYASPPMEKLAALRKMYNDAGVTIHLAKFSPGTDPAASEFAFKASRALGARGVTTEISEEAPKVQGPIALKNGQTAAFHQHLQPGEPGFPGFDHYLAMSPGVSLNLDIGHYFASTGKSAVPEITRLHDRITSLHLKDRAGPTEGQINVEWGQGGTPIADTLRLLHRNSYNINADIELEYEIPAGSNAVEEVRKCVEFCREVLTRAATPVAPRAAPRPAGAGGAGGGAPTAAPRP